MARLLETKLQPPPLRDERVYRPHIYEDLAGFDSGVVLVSAPPGFGKSTLVVEWLNSRDHPFAWLSLDRYDSDVGLFSEYLGSAVGRITGRDTSLVSLPGEQAPDPRALIATLVADLAESPPGSVLVLDDYHEIQSQEVHETVRYLVDNLPETFVLAIVSRADPPLPLARLRAQNRLREIRGADLRFDESQVIEYFRSTSGLELSSSEAGIVTERSEGWISALQLVSLGLEENEPAAVATSLSAEHPHIAGYLVDEVLDRLRPELSSFLLDTSPLERFDAQLCRDVAGIAGAADVIEEIERENAFLIPLGEHGGWYRYHHLFADLLRARMRRSDPERYTALLTKAATACEKRGLVDDAVDYALKARDVELAADIVDRNMGIALGAGEITRLRSWLRLFPVPAGPAEHVVALGWAWCRIFEGNLAAARELIDRVETSHLGEFAIDPMGQLEVMRAMIEFQAGDAPTAELHARKGLEALPASSRYMECLGHLYVGRSLHAQGKREEARPHLERAASLAERGNTLAAVTALFWLGVAAMDLGRLVDAERSMTRSQDVGANTIGSAGEPGPAAGVGDIGLAYIRLNNLEAEEAVRLAERGCRLLERSTFVEMVFRAFFVWAEALSVAGRYDDAGKVAEEGIEWLRGRKMAGGPLETWLWMAQARNALRRGRLEESGSILGRVRRGGLGSPNRDESLGFYEAADAVALALRRADIAGARRLLEDLPTDPTQNVMFSIKRLALTAALHELEGERRTAVATMEEAVSQAHEGYRFQFSFASPIADTILKRMVGRTDHDDFVRSILERLPENAESLPEQPIDPLTEREIEVLGEIAAGYSNEEIADRLFISRGTVKRHASNIYLKLGAHHRAEAAARGRELGLID